MVTFGVWGCIGAVGTAIVTNVLPIAKIAKLKAAGGTTTFVKNLIKFYKAARKCIKVNLHL
ncbi:MULTISPECIES: hypothetical protein [Heyndrickxia]|jgi:hypothetical protein|uniref:Uncharacterized protein n=1 Tax=Heyndrickxia faecalis TaxID=2824910 RepID=A0AAU7WEM6_9BACI|nr:MULTISPECIES: hypothetical protein [Heyndrickxia]MEC2304034.1 hypothetical protein [Weizmannia sp. CD-2023]MEC2339436.1 hypothetical protein [Weizmannia sp. CD-2023]